MSLNFHCWPIFYLDSPLEGRISHGFLATFSIATHFCHLFDKFKQIVQTTLLPNSSYFEYVYSCVKDTLKISHVFHIKRQTFLKHKLVGLLLGFYCTLLLIYSIGTYNLFINMLPEQEWGAACMPWRKLYEPKHYFHKMLWDNMERRKLLQEKLYVGKNVVNV